MRRIVEMTTAAGWISVIVACAIVLLSAAFSPQSTWTVRAALAGFCVLAIARPTDALLVAIPLLGFGIILSHLAGVPTLRVPEVLVVASIAGCCVRAFPRTAPIRRAISDRLSAPVVLFAIAAVASTLVWLRVYQVQTMSPAGYLQSMAHAMSVDYFVQPGEFLVIASAAAILEGLALYIFVAALCQVESSFFERALRMLALGGAALAMMSVVRLGEIVLRNPNVIDKLRASSEGLRISPQIPDYIAAGSYFSLCWLAALGLAIASARQRLAWVIASASLIAGLYLTGSRSVVAAALVGVFVLVWISFVRRRAAAFRVAIAVALLAVVLMIGGFRWMVGHDVAGETARASLWVRGELLRAGLHVIASRPVFGVGIDRFYLVAEAFASPGLKANWQSRKNPHNDLLRFGGELGLVGLGLFLWIVIPAARSIWRAIRRTDDPRLAGLASGLVAFSITSMFSNPLMLREVSYAFWIALGLAAGYSAKVEVRRDATDRPALPLSALPVTRGPSSPWRSSAAWVLGVLLLVSIPFRAKQEITTADPTRVSYGLSEWNSEPDGTRFRWSGPQATLFVGSRARRVEIPLRGTLPAAETQHVKVRLDDRLINDIAVGPDWQRLGIVLLGGDPTKPRRIQLDVSPTWVRADPVSASDDRTVVGVKVGELNVIR